MLALLLTAAGSQHERHRREVNLGGSGGMLPQENFEKRGLRSSLVQSFLIKCDTVSGQKCVFLSYYFLACH